MRPAATVLALALVLAGCGDGETSAADAGEDLTGRTFVSREVTGHELVAGTRVSIEFRDETTVRVNAGCNHLFGEIDVRRDRLDVSSMGGTEMGCDPERHRQDEWIAGLLGDAPTWELAGDTLTLTSGDVEVSLVDRAVADPDRPLEGTTWVLDGIVDGGSVSSVPTGVTGSLHVESERIGFRVCNEGSAELTIGEGELTIGGIEHTEMACDKTTMGVEAAVVATLTGRISYMIETGILRLTHPRGHGLVLRAGA